MAKRICNIVSDPELRFKRLEELKSYLIKQQYPENLINAGISKSLNIPLPDLRKIKPNEDQNPETQDDAGSPKDLREQRNLKVIKNTK